MSLIPSPTSQIDAFLVERFPSHLNLITDDLPKDSHLKTISSLGPWSVRDEFEAELYIDKVAALVSRHHIPISTAIPAITSMQEPAIQSTFEQVSLEGYEDYEDFFSQLIRLFFPISNYLINLVQDIVKPPRQASVREAILNHKNRLTRYCRCITRWEKTHYITDAILSSSLLLSLPFDIEEECRVQLEDIDNITAITKKANIIESARNHRRSAHNSMMATYHGGPQRQVFHPPPREEFETAPYHHHPVHALPAVQNQPHSPCAGCGDRHWRKSCPHAKDRCRNCEVIGHIAKVCRSAVDRDASGRISSKVLSNRSGNYISTRKDRTKLDEAITGSNVLESIKARTIQANNKRRERAARAPGHNPRREHPVLATDIGSRETFPIDVADGEELYHSN